MPRISSLAEKASRVSMYFPQQHTCSCHEQEPPPWTGEIHGLSQALLSETAPMRAFWWLIMVVCTICGVTTTTLIVIEYIKGPTATSTTIRLVDSLELPAITICPKVPDVFNETAIFRDMNVSLPNLSHAVKMDVLRFFIGGNGLENMDKLTNYNRTYLNQLDTYYKIWSKGYTTEDFFETIQEKFGYKCQDLFYQCTLGGKTMDCCNDLFRKQVIMRRGICWQTRRDVNQTEADDVGRLILSIKAPVSITSPQYNFTQPQVVVYITDNFDHVVDFPRFYLYPHEWNRMRFTARYIELIQSADVCTNRIFGKDAECTIRKWLLSNIVYPMNCTLAYLPPIPRIPKHLPVCDPSEIVDHYNDNVQLVWNSAEVKEECSPGCKRWDYQTSLQQSQTLTPFKDYVFNLETSFNDLQYEFVKEVYTTSVPGFMSQIGGQFGFFLGLSIITFVQMILYGFHFVATKVYEKSNSIYRTFSSVTASMKPVLKPTNGHLPNASEHPNGVSTGRSSCRSSKESQKNPRIDASVRSQSWELKDTPVRSFPL